MSYEMKNAYLKIHTWIAASCSLSGNGQSVLLLSVFLVIPITTIYGLFLWNPIIFDDLDFFREGSESLRYYGEAFAPFEVRWLPYASLAWTAKLFGLEMINFRVGSLILHNATAIAFFLFLQILFQSALGTMVLTKNRLSLNWIAFFAALIFALHPVAVYGAGYLIERTIVMATLFSLLSLTAYSHGLIKSNNNWLILSVVLYYLAVFSKEHAIMLPAVMLALTVLLEKPSLILLKKIWGVYAACAVIALYVVMQKAGLLGAVYEPSAQAMLGSSQIKYSHLFSCLTQSFLFFKYLFLWLLPYPEWMSVDMREPFVNDWLTLYWLALIAFIGYGVFAVRLLLKRGSQGLLGFAMLFPWLLFFSEFATVRIQEPFVLYRSYLWASGMFAVLPFLLETFSSKKAFAMLIAGGALLVPLTLDRLATFSHPFLLWDEAVELVKGKHDLVGVDRIYYNRAISLSDIDHHKEAMADFKMALDLEPRSYINHGGVALGYLKLEKYPEAVAEFSKTIEMQPNYIHAYYGRGMALLALGEKAAALADLEKSCGFGWKSGCAKAKKIREG